MTGRDSLLAQGIAAGKAGDNAAARELISQALRRNPDSETAWLWLSGVLETPQGRAFCLRQAIALNPANRTAERGLRALAQIPPAIAIVAQPAPVPKPPSKAILQTPSSVALSRQRQRWRMVIACLSIVAIGLLGALAYVVLDGSGEAEDEALAAALPNPLPVPRGTLRPTYTATASVTPTATPTATETPMPTGTDTLTPTPTPTCPYTPTATPTPTRRVRTKPPPTPTPAPTIETPHPAPPPRSLDPRLASLGVRVEPAPVNPGQPHWYLVEARWADEREAAGKHNIFIEVLDAMGGRALGQTVIVQWADGSVALTIEATAPPDWAVDFGMYNTLGSYAVSVGGSPSDRIVGLGLGTAEDPYMKVHTCFYLIFRWVN